MAHVQIIHDGEVTKLVVDGHDLSLDVLCEGFRVEFPTELTDVVRVHLVVAADTLDMDLPEAVVAALKQPKEQVSPSEAYVRMPEVSKDVAAAYARKGGGLK